MKILCACSCIYLFSFRPNIKKFYFDNVPHIYTIYNGSEITTEKSTKL